MAETSANSSEAELHREADLRKHLEFDQAIKRRKASFDQLAEAHFGAQAGSTSDPVDQLVYLRYLPKIQEAFEAQHGHIAGLFFAHRFHGGVVRTDKAMFIICDEQPRPEAMALLRQCDDLKEQANEYLRAWSFTACIGKLYGTCTNLLALLDAAASDEPDFAARYANAIQSYSADLPKVEKFLHRAARTQGEFQYCLGMLAGLLIIGGVTAIVGFLFGQLNLVTLLLIASVAGSIGAMVSVMTRLSSGSLRLVYDQGVARLRVVGAFRPLIGSTFAAITGASVLSGILPIQLPTEVSKQAAFLVVIGFISGFSERFAQDMILTTSHRLSSAAGSKETANDADSSPTQPSPEVS